MNVSFTIKLLDGRTISARPPITISGSGDYELWRSCIKLHCGEDLTALQGRRFKLSVRQGEPAEIVLSEDKSDPNMMEKVFCNDQGEWELHFVRVRSEDVRRMAARMYEGDTLTLDGGWW